MTGQINVNKIAARTGNTITINSGDKISGAAGAISVPGTIVQTLQSIKTDTQTIATSFSFTQISGLTVNITSKEANSKFLLSTSIVVGHAYYSAGFKFAKDGTAISPVGDADGGPTQVSWGFNFYDANNGSEDHNVAMVSYQYLYSPSVAAGTSIAFDVHGAPYSSDYVLQINRPNNASTAASRIRGTSQLLVQEIAQ
tara:strand:- start:33 stop:626 length:594 start_codon:yes stop_codon:yes gene_type:complete